MLDLLRAPPGTLLLVEVLGTGFVAGSSWYGTCCGWFWVLDGLQVRPGHLVWSWLVALYLWSHAYLGLVSAGLAAFVHAWFGWSRPVSAGLCGRAWSGPVSAGLAPFVRLCVLWGWSLLLGLAAFGLTCPFGACLGRSGSICESIYGFLMVSAGPAAFVRHACLGLVVAMWVLCWPWLHILLHFPCCRLLSAGLPSLLYLLLYFLAVAWSRLV